MIKRKCTHIKKTSIEGKPGMESIDKHHCYETYGAHPYSEIVLVEMKGENIVIGYKPFSATWYAYNSETGVEIASFRSEFYKKFIEPFKVGTAKRSRCKC